MRKQWKFFKYTNTVCLHRVRRGSPIFFHGSISFNRQFGSIDPYKLKILVLNLPKKKFNLAFRSFCKNFLVFRENILIVIWPCYPKSWKYFLNFNHVREGGGKRAEAALDTGTVQGHDSCLNKVGLILKLQNPHFQVQHKFSWCRDNFLILSVFKVTFVFCYIGFWAFVLPGAHHRQITQIISGKLWDDWLKLSQLIWYKL